MSPSVPLGSKVINSKEIGLITQCLRNVGATEDELRLFFDPVLMQDRINEWFDRLRHGDIRKLEPELSSDEQEVLQMAAGNLLPVVQQEAYRNPQSD